MRGLGKGGDWIVVCELLVYDSWGSLQNLIIIMLFIFGHMGRCIIRCLLGQ